MVRGGRRGQCRTPYGVNAHRTAGTPGTAFPTVRADNIPLVLPPAFMRGSPQGRGSPAICAANSRMHFPCAERSGEEGMQYELAGK